MLRMNLMRALVALAMMAVATPAFAQATIQKTEQPPPVEEIKAPLTVVDSEQPIPIPVPPAEASPIDGRQAAAVYAKPQAPTPAVQQSPETKYRVVYYEHLDRMNQITEGKFVWQDRASEVTLWLVVFIVVAGVFLSFFQIWIAFHKGGKIGDTSIEASAQNFRVTSSVVGIIVLLISTGFLYLFLQHVYEIKVVDLRSPGDQPVTTAPPKPKTEADYHLPPSDAPPPPAANGPARQP